jgi:acetyl-CoA synthetase
MTQLEPTFDPERWVPPADRIDGYRISQLVRASGASDLRALASRAEAEPEWFYPFVQEFLGSQWPRPWTVLKDDSAGEPLARWFPDGGTNLAWLACERWVSSSEGPAVIWESDGGEVRELSYAELDQQVSAAAAGLRRLGVQPGDVVTMHLPVVPEALMTMLAVARIGAIVAPAFSGYGPDPLAERLRLGGARVLVTADGTMRRGRRVPMLETALEAVAHAPDVEQIVVVARLGDALEQRPGRPPMSSWSDLVAGGPDRPLEVLDAGTPWLLAFTSGSTGRPKGALHTHGGMGYSLMLDLGLTLDVQPGDRFAWPADMGWLAGPMAGLGPLTLGATTVLFDGVMDFPAPDRLWSLVERHGVTQLGMAPTVARTLMAFGEQWVEPFALPTLRIIASSGEPWTASAWRWLHRTVGRGRAPIVNWSGGTEIGGPILVSFPSEPALGARFWGPQLGIAADVVDRQGQPLVDAEGELVIRRSWPNMTQSLWREPERYLDAYWRTVPGMWVHGDRATRFADGSFEVPGRSDDVLKIAGKRVGPSELEALACEVPGVTTAAAIGLAHPTKGEVAVLAVLANPARTADPALPGEVSDHLAQAFGKAMRPAAVVVLDSLPLTRSGKVHRRVLRGWVAGQDAGDLSTLENPEIRETVEAAGVAVRASISGPG